MMKTPWLKKHTFQNIFKFQNVKFECLHSYIKILNKNIRIWALLYLHKSKIIDKYKMIAKMLWPLTRLEH